MVWQDHPALIDDVMATIDLEFDLGIDWVYHDNPFREMVGWREWAESRRQYHVNTRHLIQGMADRLTEFGGGLVAIEQGRLGLNTLQAGAGAITGRLIPGGQPSSFADAMFHGRHLTAFAGDIIGEAFNFVPSGGYGRRWFSLSSVPASGWPASPGSPKPCRAPSTIPRP